jgi:protein tyrosine/serine phosphatase
MDPINAGVNSSTPSQSEVDVHHSQSGTQMRAHSPPAEATAARGNDTASLHLIETLNDNAELLRPRTLNDFRHFTQPSFIGLLQKRAKNNVDEFKSLVLASAFNEIYNPVAFFENNRMVFGSEVNALNKPLLLDLGITHILNMAGGYSKNFYADEKVFSYKSFELEDTPEALLPIDEALAFIDQALKNDGKVLIHCIEGKSRSGSIVAAYMMRKHGCTYEEAAQKISIQRRIAPNEGFISQLKSHFSVNTR